MGTIDIIRIPLKVGVRFVTNILLREEAAFPESVLGGPHISKEPDQAFAWGEQQLADAQAEGKISSSSTAADVKEVVLLNKRLDEDPEYYTPHSFKFNWV